MPSRRAPPDRLDGSEVDHGAFVPGPRLVREGAPHGPLQGWRVAVKDLFDVQGDPTGCGNPDWPGGQVPAGRTAWAVQALLDAGARIVGKTVTDEISLGLLGRNRHVGTPVNPIDPARMPGGSSSGSGVAVAAGHADIGLGSDSGGSVRVPASFLGLWGLRPSHGVIPTDGLMTQSPSFDTVGLLARSAADLARAMDVLLPRDTTSAGGLAIATDAFAQAKPGLRQACDALLPMLQEVVGPAERLSLAGPDGLAMWAETLATVQSAEFGATFRPWLEEEDPRLCWGVAQALADALRLSPETIEAARRGREAISKTVDARLGRSWLCLPTCPGPAPLRDLRRGEFGRADRDLVRLLCVAGLTERPQLSMPLLQQNGLPVGLSLIGPRGSDRALLALGTKLAARMG